MTTVAVVGTSAERGAAIARRFGAAGHDVAFVSRSLDRLGPVVCALRGEGVRARVYAADAHDADALVLALDRTAQDLSAIEVLVYDPPSAPGARQHVLETSPEEIQDAVERAVVGLATAVEYVVGGQRVLGRGSVLGITDDALARGPFAAGASFAAAAVTAYLGMLRDALAPDGIQVARLVSAGADEHGGPSLDPAGCAELLWHLHTHPAQWTASVAAASDPPRRVPGGRAS